MNNKRGISLMVLVLTIIIMIILASVVIYISADSVNNAKMASLAEDITNIEDLISEYYLNNNELPIVSGISYSKANVVDLITDGSTVLSEEINQNGDDSSLFYKVDLSKLPIESSSRGVGDNGVNDIYLVSSQNFNVYYLKGEKIAGQYYFSLTQNLTGKNRVNSSLSEDTSNITISNPTSGIKLTKSASNWTNILTVTVETTLAANEKIEYLLAGTSIGTSTTGTFTINISDALNANTTLKNTFYSNDENKVLVVNKYNTSTGANVLIATASLNVSNLDMLSGTSMPTITYSKYSDFILANISGYTDLGGSGIKESRVIYTKKLDADGNEAPYYNDLPTEITAEYVKNTGISMNSNVLKLPIDVVEYVIVFIDNAGNASTPAKYTI